MISIIRTWDYRLDSKYPICNMFKLFVCAICQVEIKPGEGISIHAGTADPRKLRPWDGPFLCVSCQEKKEAMEGKRPSGGMHLLFLHSMKKFRNYATVFIAFLCPCFASCQI